MRHYVDLREEWKASKIRTSGLRSESAKVAAKRLGVRPKDVIEYAPGVFVRRRDLERAAKVDDKRF